MAAAKAERRSKGPRQILPHNDIRQREGGASHGPEHNDINIEDARNALTKHSRRIFPPYDVTVNPWAEEEDQVQIQEGKGGNHVGTGRQTEHTNINYKMAQEKLEKERD